MYYTMIDNLLHSVHFVPLFHNSWKYAKWMYRELVKSHNSHYFHHYFPDTSKWVDVANSSRKYYDIWIERSSASQVLSMEEESSRERVRSSYFDWYSGASGIRHNAWYSHDEYIVSNSRLCRKSSEVSSDIRDSWISWSGCCFVHEWSAYRSLSEVSFVVYFNLVSITFGKLWVSVVFIGEWVGWFLTQTSSSYTALEVLHDGSSNGSLVPNDSSWVGDGESVIW